MKSYLRVKIKSLAEEARIIRVEERRTKAHRASVTEHQGEPKAIESLTTEFEGLHRHRTIDVRDESRVALLAYAILRDRPYIRVEPPASRKPNVGRIAELIARYGYVKKDEARVKVDEWLKAAPA